MPHGWWGLEGSGFGGVGVSTHSCLYLACFLVFRDGEEIKTVIGVISRGRKGVREYEMFKCLY